MNICSLWPTMQLPRQSQSAAFSRAFVFILLFVFVLFDLAVCPLFLHLIASKHYPNTLGTVTGYDIVDTFLLGNTGVQNRDKYVADFNYQFTANDKVFEGTGRLKEAFSTPADAKNAVAALHPIGSKVTVFYDPKNPTFSLLFSGIKSGAVTFIVILIIVNCGILFWAIRKLFSPNS